MSLDIKSRSSRSLIWVDNSLVFDSVMALNIWHFSLLLSFFFLHFFFFFFEYGKSNSLPAVSKSSQSRRILAPTTVPC